MNKERILNVRTRSEWRNWLQQNFSIETEIWLVYAKKSSGEQRIPYNDAVEEALCFGWIDSTNKSLDKNHTIQRFSPRKPSSKYSQPNIERLKWLAGNNLIHHTFVETVQEIISHEFIFPKDILDELKKNKTVWNNYIIFPEQYKRIRIAYIDSARKRPEEFTKRLTNFIQKTRDNKRIPGFGGIDKYY
ncbi:MAG TPA: YdeI/OmpD-associated family protein [Lentimicrobium sp.]|nr:YdeI/OmpD-associated family protein [Lentimicrobium sp.]